MIIYASDSYPGNVWKLMVLNVRDNLSGSTTFAKRDIWHSRHLSDIGMIYWLRTFDSRQLTPGLCPESIVLGSIVRSQMSWSQIRAAVKFCIWNVTVQMSLGNVTYGKCRVKCLVAGHTIYLCTQPSNSSYAVLWTPPSKLPPWPRGVQKLKHYKNNH